MKNEIPVVAFDYAFLPDRTGKIVEEEEAIDQDVSEADGGIIKTLVGHDSKPKCCTAIPIPQHGIDADEWAVRETLKFLDFLGYQKLIIKSDQ